MKKILLILVAFLSLNANQINFTELTKLASEDIKTNIYLDKDIPNYEIDLSLPRTPAKGEIFSLYNMVLADNNLTLQYNLSGKFYFIKQKEKQYSIDAPLPVHPDVQKNYYTYKIENITNDDVVNAMKIFGVKYQYLKQSDIIAYSATKEQHLQIHDILYESDNAVRQSSIKLTLFSVNKNNLQKYGSTVRAISYSFDSQIDNILGALKHGQSTEFKLNDQSLFSFSIGAMSGYSVIDIFQEPTIKLTNGIETSVSSVVNIPFLETTTQTDAMTNQTTEQYSYKDVGLQIKITPKINGDWIYLDMNLISDEIISNDDYRPITQKITYKSSVQVSKGEPVLLTGIKKSSKQFLKDGVPLLQDLPVLGHLFKNRSDTTEEQNINILIEVL